MSCKGVGEEPLVAREPPPQGIGYTQMRRPALDVGRRGLRALDLLQGAREGERVARELRAHVIRQVFPLAAHAQRQELSDDRGEDPGKDPHDQQDQEERAGLLPPVARPAAQANDAGGAVVHQGHRADERRERRHQAHVQVLHVPELVRHHCLQLVAVAEVEQPLGHGDVGVQRVRAGREGVGVGIVDDPDPRAGDAGGDRHLLDHVDELSLPVRRRIDHLAGARRPQHLVRPRLVGVRRHRHGDEREQDAEPREGMVIRGARCVDGVEVVDVVAAEPQPREECDEANHQQCGAPAIGLLLLKQIQSGRVAHTLGFIERSTCGTALSWTSSISHRSAGCAFAIPATTLVGNCCCLVLYWVAVSL